MRKTAIQNLYFNEINEKRLNNVKRLFGENISITQKDFLLFEEKEAYDLVVSNPPYARFNNGKRVAKNHNLSREFIAKAIRVTKKGGYILFIAPNNWMSFSDRNILPRLMSSYQFHHLNISGAKKWFPQVGSSFTWFLLQKVPNTRPFTIENNYILKEKQTATLNPDVNFIPLYYSQEVRTIINKTLQASLPKYAVETSSNLHKYTKKHLIKDTKDAIHKYKIIHTPTQVVWSSLPHKYQTGWKVFISLTNQYSTFIDCCGMTQSIAFIRCESQKEAMKIQQELNHDIYRFLNNITRYGNFNNIRVLQCLPILSTIPAFTLAEQSLIDRFNSAYYN